MKKDNSSWIWKLIILLLLIALGITFLQKG